MKQLMQEFATFVREQKTSWIVPMVLLAVILAIVIVLRNTNVAPFIYSFF